MSYLQDGRPMERPPTGGSVRRARELAMAGIRPDQASQVPRLPRTMEDDQPQIAQPSLNPRRPIPQAAPGPSRLSRPQAPSSLQTRDGQIGVAISRPTQVPQWPLPGPVAGSSETPESEPYRPPPGKSQPPQRPPRPSQVPSILDGSKIQDHTPVFQYKPQSSTEPVAQDIVVIPETPTSISISRPSTVSSVGSIPDFPLPGQMPGAPPRRSVNLGPPPSARRGASSFYSNASYVSPIPEESPRQRSHTSFASSAAMPESWGSPSPGPSPQYPESFYDEVITEEGNPYDDDAEESRLVRSASLGKRAKPVLVTTAGPRDPDGGDSGRRPDPVLLQSGPFQDGTGYMDASTSSSGTLPTTKVSAPPVALTADSILDAYSAASSTDPSNPSRFTPSPQPPGARPYSRLSVIRRPPQLDIDAVKKAQARGSLTSLPDLIRRATKLAASLEKGRRPASRIDLSDFPDSDGSGPDGERGLSFDGEKHRSGLSDMLAAFPPPAQVGGRRSIRESLREQVLSWPLPLTMNRGRSNNTSKEHVSDSSQFNSRKRRRCCGLPLWGFVIVVVIGLILVATAVVVPLGFLVIKKQSNVNQNAEPALEQCQAQLSCQNGGTTIISQGACSCICANGFTGSDCSSAGAMGCTTTSLTGDTNISNVTLGEAIPRLIAQASTNFSIPLSPTVILAKLNAGNLSCSAENALVTFDGRSIRQGDALEIVNDPGVSSNAAVSGDKDLPVADGVAYDIVTVTESAAAPATVGGGSSAVTPAPGVTKRDDASGFSTIITAPEGDYFSTTFTFSSGRGLTTTITPTLTRTITTTIPASTPSGSDSAGTGLRFTVTEEILDFARVATLFVLQEDSLSDAVAAQNVLQRLFTTASVGGSSSSNGVPLDQARNVTLGNGNSIDLVQFRVDVGGDLSGGKASSLA